MNITFYDKHKLSFFMSSSISRKNALEGFRVETCEKHFGQFESTLDARPSVFNKINKNVQDVWRQTKTGQFGSEHCQYKSGAKIEDAETAWIR